MHAWNSDFVRQNWERQSVGHLLKLNGRTSIQATGVAAVYRKLLAEDGGPEGAEARLEKAKEMARAGHGQSPWPFQGASRGLFMMMLSELGRREELTDLLEFADRRLSPTWERGGLFYPRHDETMDESGDYVHVEPHSGNSAIGYARLNVENGQKIMWEKPWTSQALRSRPRVEGCSLADEVDFLRGWWDEERRAMIVTVKAWEADYQKPQEVTLAVHGLDAGEWAVYIDGELQKTQQVRSDGSMEVLVAVVPAVEVDVVVWKVAG